MGYYKQGDSGFTVEELEIGDHIMSTFHHCKVPWTGGISGSILEQVAMLKDKDIADILEPKHIDLLLVNMCALDVIGAHSLSEQLDLVRTQYGKYKSKKWNDQKGYADPKACHSDK